MNKVRIWKLPETKDVLGAKRWVEDKGEFAQISYGEEIRHLAFFELKKGYMRGGHYHKEKEETFYVIDGRMYGICIDTDTGERREYIVGKGEKMFISPRCGHIFYGMEDTLVVEYSPQKYVSEDTVAMEFGDVAPASGGTNRSA